MRKRDDFTAKKKVMIGSSLTTMREIFEKFILRPKITKKIRKMCLSDEVKEFCGVEEKKRVVNKLEMKDLRNDAWERVAP